MLPKGRSTRAREKPLMQEGPTVPDIIDAIGEPRATLLSALRTLVLELPGAVERAVWDGFCREWTPGYYFGDRQLFHVHDFRGGLRATVFVGIRTLEPVILDAEAVSHELRQRVAETSVGRGTKQVKFPIDSIDDVNAFMEVIRVKWSALQKN